MTEETSHGIVRTTGKHARAHTHTSWGKQS